MDQIVLEHVSNLTGDMKKFGIQKGNGANLI